MEPFKVGRRDVWRAEGRGWRRRLRNPGIAGLPAGGLALMLAAGWWYWESTAFAHRSVVAGAVVETVHGPARLENEDGSVYLKYRGTVRYEAAGRTVRTNVHLRTCTPTCLGDRLAPGTRVTVAYDPDRPARARRAPEGGLSAAPGQGMLLLAGLGAVFLAFGAHRLVLGDGGPD